jgi:hypothetical protein
MQKSIFGIAVVAAMVAGGTMQGSHAAGKKVVVPVVAGAKALNMSEKGLVDGQGIPVTPDCPPPPIDCIPVPIDAKPGYGFGTEGHYGPPGHGFATNYSWRGVVAGGLTTTLRGNPLPAPAFR